MIEMLELILSTWPGYIAAVMLGALAMLLFFGWIAGVAQSLFGSPDDV